jgi:hypothetical protein
MPAKMPSEKDKKLLKEAQDRLKNIMEDEGENRKIAFEDLEFVYIPGKQWPELIKAEREGNQQPCLEINKMPTFLAQVVGDQRMNRPSIKVVPVDDKADPEVARILGGWIKHVQQISKSDVAIDHGFEHAVSSAYGALRVVTDYISETSFDQEAYIKKIDNALAVFWGPHSEYDCSDAEYCFVVTDMPREEYESKYGEDPVPFNTADSAFVEGWSTKETVRVAEYFVKEYEDSKIYLLEDKRVVDKLEEGDKEVQSRTVSKCTIRWYLLTGNGVLDRKDWLGKKYIPIIPIWGKEINVGGKKLLISLIRYAKDAQRMYNYWSSADTEVVALQPKAPYFVTAKMIGDNKVQWDQAHKKNYPYLLVTPDKEAPGLWPHREPPPQASAAMNQKIQQADKEMRDTVGIQEANLGMRSNERSGVAIRERKQEGDVGTFSFIDNLTRSIEHLGRVLIDIAPALIDTERVIRMGLDDGSVEFATVNKETSEVPVGNPTAAAVKKIQNDLTVGTYDCVVSTGPNFTTQRSEARQSMQEFIQYYPAAAPVIGDLYAKAMDWNGAVEVGERLEYLLPPEIKAKLAAKKAQKTGQPPEQLPQQQPNPEQVLKLEEEKLKLEEMKVKLQQEQEKLKALQVKTELMIAESKENVKKMLDEIVKEHVEGQAKKGVNVAEPGNDVTQPPPPPDTATNVGTPPANSDMSV